MGDISNTKDNHFLISELTSPKLKLNVLVSSVDCLWYIELIFRYTIESIEALMRLCFDHFFTLIKYFLP